MKNKIFVQKAAGLTLNTITLSVNVPELQKSIESERLDMVNTMSVPALCAYAALLISVLNRVRAGSENSVVMLQMVLVEYVLIIIWALT